MIRKFRISCTFKKKKSKFQLLHSCRLQEKLQSLETAQRDLGEEQGKVRKLEQELKDRTSEHARTAEKLGRARTAGKLGRARTAGKLGRTRRRVREEEYQEKGTGM